MRESVKQGYLKKDQAVGTFKIDKERVSGVFDFLVTKGLISGKKE